MSTKMKHRTKVAGLAALVALVIGAGSAAPTPVPVPVARLPGDLHEQCINAIRSGDPEYLATARSMVLDDERRELHSQEAKLIALNDRHVVIAYIVLWLLAAGFVLSLWRRQARLRGQIADLERDLVRALDGESKP